MTSAHVGNDTYSYSASFDVLARPTDVKTQRVSDGATLFEEAPSYDAVGNITSETLTLPTGTDTQEFCYDEFSRLTWAGSTGTPPCTGTAITPGTLTAAQYTQTLHLRHAEPAASAAHWAATPTATAPTCTPPLGRVRQRATPPATTPAAI